jgi:hypothetical protein
VRKISYLTLQSRGFKSFIPFEACLHYLSAVWAVGKVLKRFQVCIPCSQAIQDKRPEDIDGPFVNLIDEAMKLPSHLSIRNIALPNLLHVLQLGVSEKRRLPRTYLHIYQFSWDLATKAEHQV